MRNNDTSSIARYNQFARSTLMVASNLINIPRLSCFERRAPQIIMLIVLLFYLVSPCHQYQPLWTQYFTGCRIGHELRRVVYKITYLEFRKIGLVFASPLLSKFETYIKSFSSSDRVAWKNWFNSSDIELWNYLKNQNEL